MRIDPAKLAYELVKNDLTLKALSAKSGVSRPTLCYIKGGKRCSDTTGIKIANALDVDIKDLLED
ncbi:MAG: helix-turn-helix domain-containing protein [Clostridia bacterium]|jgi:lambda repressor-like predicted transcriptional regulator|nr:helix-turn-helix domain-containing protein [Clostridia bacterium]MCI1999007.1 helix-turn-helix domain-containing protein [Clostridia bacterium]MCI2013757.1 helix-turn-helix domain-containing protein [Clostridia bacterium]